MKVPCDRRASTFDELVEEYLDQLEEAGEIDPLELDEDGVLENLAEMQRLGGRSPRLDAFVAACWRYWVERSPYAAERRHDAGEGRQEGARP